MFFVIGTLVCIILAGRSGTRQAVGIEKTITTSTEKEMRTDSDGEHKEVNVSMVTLKTEDGIMLKGTFYQGNTNGKGIILLHMLGRTRRDWDAFASRLQRKEGYSVISIDSRGHGESSGDRGFVSGELNKMALDVKAAKQFLADKEISTVGIAGASIGANTALNYAASDPSVKSIVLMSPGLDYRGVQTEQSSKKYGGNVLVIASREDSYAADSSQALYGNIPGKKQIKIYQGLGHGTAMLSSEEVQSMIFDWLRETVK